MRSKKTASSGRRRGAAPLVICILSRKKTLYSTRRLVQAAKAQGHKAVVLDTLRCNVLVESDRPALRYGSEPVPPPDVAIPRIGASITSYGLAVVAQLEMMGVPLVNNAMAIAQSRDKLRCLQILGRHGVSIPTTVMAHRRTDVGHLVEKVGGPPVIVKLPQGTQGIGVMIARTRGELETLLNTFWDLGHDILLQQFVQESEGRDVRALVVGDRVVAAMRRQAKAGEFRSNIHRGGEGKPIELPPEDAATAVRAAQILGLQVAGVDMLESKHGPKVIEVNSSPGFEGIEGATGLDIAGTIIRHAAELAVAKKAASKMAPRG